MANVFAILTAIVLAVSAFLSYKNWEAYKVQIAERQKEEATLSRNREKLARTIKLRDDTKAEREATEHEAAMRGQELAAAEQKNREIAAQIQTNQAKIAENKKQIDDIETRLKEAGDIETLVGEVKTLSRQIEQLKLDIQAAESELANLTAEKARTEHVIADYQAEQKRIANKQSSPKLKTSIRSVFGTWGFVTLSSGNTAGVVPGSSLEVVRDGETICKLLVNTVEASSAAADIVPGSLKADTVLMVGDSVIPAKPVEPAAAKPGGPAKKPAPGGAAPGGAAPAGGLVVPPPSGGAPAPGGGVPPPSGGTPAPGAGVPAPSGGTPAPGAGEAAPGAATPPAADGAKPAADPFNPGQ